MLPPAIPRSPACEPSRRRPQAPLRPRPCSSFRRYWPQRRKRRNMIAPPLGRRSQNRDLAPYTHPSTARVAQSPVPPCPVRTIPVHVQSQPTAVRWVGHSIGPYDRFDARTKRPPEDRPPPSAVRLGPPRLPRPEHLRLPRRRRPRIPPQDRPRRLHALRRRQSHRRHRGQAPGPRPHRRRNPTKKRGHSSFSPRRTPRSLLPPPNPSPPAEKWRLFAQHSPFADVVPSKQGKPHRQPKERGKTMSVYASTSTHIPHPPSGTPSSTPTRPSSPRLHCHLPCCKTNPNLGNPANLVKTHNSAEPLPSNARRTASPGSLLAPTRLPSPARAPADCLDTSG